MKAVDGLCEAVKEEGILCGTALANVNLPATKQHLVGQDTWGAAAWIKASDRYMKHLDFWGVNLYTRRYFAPMGLFHRFHDVSNRPLVITEYGVTLLPFHHSSTQDIIAPPLRNRSPQPAGRDQSDRERAAEHVHDVPRDGSDS